MKLNVSKSKFMLFNPTINFDFIPEFELEGRELETMEEIKLLGLIISNDLTWKSNTDNMIHKAYSRLWMIKRLKKRGASLDDLTEIYTKQVRSVLEFGVPVWNSALTKDESHNIERVQKSFLHIALGNGYRSYPTALDQANLENLEERRTKICRNFAEKAAKHPKHKHWFVPNNPPGPSTRSKKVEYKVPISRLSRFKKSPIPYLTSLLNT